MHLDALSYYIVCEFEYETQRDTYFADCAWINTSECLFQETNEPKKPQKYKTTPTYPRWHEVRNPYETPKKAQKSEKIDAFDIIGQIADGNG